MVLPLRVAAPSVAVRLLRVSEERAGAEAEREVLGGEERTRHGAFVRAVDRDRYLVAHVGLRRELGARLGLAPDAVPLTRLPCPLCGGAHGRPAVAGATGERLHFSLSHAGDLVLLAFAPVPVGADVESHPSAATTAETARALHPDERAELASLPAPQRPAAFARCWTRKEAYLKARGVGLGEDPAVCYVGTGDRPGRPPGWPIADVDAADGYAAAVAYAE